MTPGETDNSRRVGGLRLALIAASCAAVIAILSSIAVLVGRTLEADPDPAHANYNLLLQGFESGHLNLLKKVPAGFARLPDPYDPVANGPYRFHPYRLHDMSYYRGKFYLYFGATPVLLAYWPWKALTGHFLGNEGAAIGFAAIGFLAATGILLMTWRRFFPATGAGVVAACALALGLADGVPVLLQRPGVCEIPICCAHALVMLAILAILLSILVPARRGAWLAAASLVYGLAVASRPSLLFGAVILAVPLALQPFSPGAGGRQRLAAAAVIPISLVIAGMLAYNVLRFGSPLEFGQHYQLLVGSYRGAEPTFSLRYLLYNLRVNFIEPVHLAGRFPFVADISAGPMPRGHAAIESPFGVLVNTPVTLLALAAPLGIRALLPTDRPGLRGLTWAAALAFAVPALTLCLFWGACSRYEVDFLPPLVLLAVLGILGLESALAERPAARRITRTGWGCLLAISIAFNLCASLQHYPEQSFEHGRLMLEEGRLPEAIADNTEALRFQPKYTSARDNLGVALARSGRADQAVAQFRLALALDSKGDSITCYNLALFLAQRGETREPIELLRRALTLDPKFTPAAAALRRLEGISAAATPVK